jgi:hypothetical protein
MYLVTITWLDGQITRATISRKGLRSFKLQACRGCGLKIERLS